MPETVVFMLSRYDMTRRKTACGYHGDLEVIQLPIPVVAHNVKNILFSVYQHLPLLSAKKKSLHSIG